MPKLMPISNIKPQEVTATGQTIPLLHLMHMTQTLQVRTATAGVTLMIT